MCDNNRPARPAVPKPSPLSQIATVDEVESDVDSAGSGMDTDLEEFDHADSDLLSALLGTEAEEKKSGRRVSKSDAAKRAQLPDELSDYIHAVKYRRLYSLACYDDTTYVIPSDAAD